MPSKLPDNFKSIVIQDWLSGKQRDKIATDNGVSAGAVTNIVNEWRTTLGFHSADSLRDLAVSLKRVNISPAQCADGFRVAMMLNRLGIKEDNFESFMSDVYNRCCNVLGLQPQHIESYINNLLEFSQTVPFSQIPNYIQQKIDEKERLEQEIQKLEDKIGILQMQMSDSEQHCNLVLEDHRITKENLKWYSHIKEELEKKYGIPVNDISKLAVIVNGCRHIFGNDVNKLVDALSNLESVKTEYDRYLILIKEMGNQYSALNNQLSELKENVDSYKQSLSVYEQLVGIGFGLKELKLLRNTIFEIAYANNISRENAVSKFFIDIEQQYDDKLGFESKVDKLQVDVNKLYQQEMKLLGEINAIPRLGVALAKLFYVGYGNNNDNNNNSIEELELLIDNVRRSGSIKAVIKKLSQPTDEQERKREDADNKSNSSSSSKEREMEEEGGQREEVVLGQEDDPAAKAEFKSKLDRMLGIE